MSVKAHRRVVHHRTHRHRKQSSMSTFTMAGRKKGTTADGRAHRKVVHRRRARKVSLARPDKYIADIYDSRLPVLPEGMSRIMPWVAGGNDRWPVCGAAAAANSLLIASGHAVPAAAVLALHDRARGDRVGADMADVLDALLAGGLAGIRPRAVALLAGGGALLPGDLVIVRLGAEAHAAAVGPAGWWVTWGELAAPLGAVEDAWRITW